MCFSSEKFCLYGMDGRVMGKYYKDKKGLVGGLDSVVDQET